MEEHALVYSAFTELRRLTPDEVHRIGDDIPVPSFSVAAINRLLNSAELSLKKGNTLVRIDDNAIIVGDIHGKLHDLIRIMSTYKYPPITKYIFLGDYVDRGEYSLECILFLLSMLLEFPDHITLLRGNHEFPSVNSIYAFQMQIELKYECIELWERFNAIFSWLPLAAVVRNKYFLVHGGIPSTFEFTLKDIASLELQISSASNPLVEELVWADPAEMGLVNGLESLKGNGHYFGQTTTSTFLKHEGLQTLIRAHQCVDGVKGKFNNSVLTVFSSSGYDSEGTNSAGALRVIEDDILVRTFKPVPHVGRASAFFFEVRDCMANLTQLLRKRVNRHRSLSLAGFSSKPGKKRTMHCSPISSSLPMLAKQEN